MDVTRSVAFVDGRGADGSWASEDGEAYTVGATFQAVKALKHYNLLPAQILTNER
jgi:hypothetical protein